MSAEWSGNERPTGRNAPAATKSRRRNQFRKSELRRDRPVISAVAPAHNEAANLPALVEETVLALRGLAESCGSRGFEIIVVDDASTDETPWVLERLAAVHPELRCFRMARRGGQSAALFAGLGEARGDWIATLDADLQNDPADIVRLWEALPGHDAVLGYRRTRADGRVRRLTALLANWARNGLLGHDVRDAGCSLRLFPRTLGTRLPAFHGAHRFIGPLLLREGCDLVQVPVEHRPRRHGRSHYGFGNRSLGVVLDLIGMAWLMKRSLGREFSQVGRNPAAPRSRVGLRVDS